MKLRVTTRHPADNDGPHAAAPPRRTKAPDVRNARIACAAFMFIGHLPLKGLGEGP